MDIKQLTKLPNGGAEFVATAGPEELRFVTEVGLNFLLMQGAIPIVKQTHDGPEISQ